MLQEVRQAFEKITASGPLLDATFGRGGHTRSLVDCFDRPIYAMDRDPHAISWGKEILPQVHFIQDRFSTLNQWFAPNSLAGILLDLGVSSPQLDEPSRGFSFQKEGPLDMRMSQEGKTASDILNSATEREIADILYTYGEERASRKIARAIVAQRPLTSTSQLSSIVAKHFPYGSRRHAATRVFQALRIAVNQELDELTTLLPLAQTCLKPGGMLVVISFHSLEDRIVKTFFKHNPAFVSLKKPLKPSEEEIQTNRRSRSAIFREGLRQ